MFQTPLGHSRGLWVRTQSTCCLQPLSAESSLPLLRVSSVYRRQTHTRPGWRDQDLSVYGYTAIPGCQCDLTRAVYWNTVRVSLSCILLILGASSSNWGPCCRAIIPTVYPCCSSASAVSDLIRRPHCKERMWESPLQTLIRLLCAPLSTGQSCAGSSWQPYQCAPACCCSHSLLFASLSFSLFLMFM